MNKKTYVLLADAFGYGPITTLIGIAKELKKQDVNLIFVGPKFCLEKIKKEHICKKHICMKYIDKEIEKNINYFLKADKIIAVETTDILIYLINHYNLKNIYLIDNLFWMWDFIEEELKKLKTYYISTVINCDENIKRTAKSFKNIKKVGALRDLSGFKKVEGNNLMISLGGVKSYMLDSKNIYRFYLKTVKLIINNKNISKFEKVYITGGKEIIKYLKDNIVLKKKIIIKSYSNKEYLKKLYQCRYAIMSPGLGNFNEIISSNINVMFLLPINYSQYLQRIKYKQICNDFHYQENRNENLIKEYLEESIGVNFVVNNLKKYDYKDLDKEISEYLNSNVNELERYELYKTIDKNGVQEVVNDLARR